MGNQLWKEFDVFLKYQNVAIFMKHITRIIFIVTPRRPVMFTDASERRHCFQFLRLESKPINQSSLCVRLPLSLFDHEPSFETSVNFYRSVLPHIL
jgi:hypothetical protein